jgi:hypothetical protein
VDSLEKWKIFLGFEGVEERDCWGLMRAFGWALRV